MNLMGILFLFISIYNLIFKKYVWNAIDGTIKQSK